MAIYIKDLIYLFPVVNGAVFVLELELILIKNTKSKTMVAKTLLAKVPIANI